MRLQRALDDRPRIVGSDVVLHLAAEQEEVQRPEGSERRVPAGLVEELGDERLLAEPFAEERG
jgi:hypothetical protein